MNTSLLAGGSCGTVPSLVDRILAAKRANPAADTSGLEREIDERAYQLYGLTADEIKIVEGAQKREEWNLWTRWTSRRAMSEPLIPKHGGCRNLKSFQVAEAVYDLTVRFCDKCVSRRSRTHDQMVQAARSGRQNIAEGSMASGTSKKIEIKLAGIAKASLEELRLDFEDYLRQHRLPLWDRNDSRRVAPIAARPATADDVAAWAVGVKSGRFGHGGRGGQTAGSKSTQSAVSTESTSPEFPEIAANGAPALIAVATALLDRQIQAQAAAFEKDGGFTERLYKTRTQARREIRAS